MRLIKALISVALVADAAFASSWFTKAGKFAGNLCPMHCESKNAHLQTFASAYNKWHETELERWLSDHDIPYPTPADRKDLEKLISNNWDAYAVAPYKNWDTDKLTAYLQQKGVDVKDSANANKDSLVSQVAGSWYETEDKAQDAYGSVKDWILDTWTDSQLKAFCDHNGIPGEPQNSHSPSRSLRANNKGSSPTPQTRYYTLQGPFQL